jgi:hypothetical protein
MRRPSGSPLLPVAAENAASLHAHSVNAASLHARFDAVTAETVRKGNVRDGVRVI